MISLPLTRLAATAGGLALSLTAGVGLAAAAPNPDPLINTTCNYSQMVAAMHARSPAAAAQFNTMPEAEAFLQSFLASAPPHRQQMLEHAHSMPEAATYVELVRSIAKTCSDY